MSAAHGHGDKPDRPDAPAGAEPRPIDVRYCGGCNPAIDRVAIVAAVVEVMTDGRSANGRVATAAAASPGDDRDDPAAGRTGGDAPPTLFVSGCRRACASGHRLRLGDQKAVVVAGEHVDAVPTAAASLAETVVRSLAERVDRPGDAHAGRVTGSRKGKE